MAMMEEATLDDVEGQLRSIITNLYYLETQTHGHEGAATQQMITDEMKRLMRNLRELAKTARRLPTHIPIELIQYVEQARNPDIYTREFVELVMRYNQQQKGRSEAFASFRDILAEQMAVGIPEIKEDVKAIVRASGGQLA